ncbi:MAG: sugar ABC transporter substrate-binding protein [Lachnospiraceae bacterium]
MKRKKYFHLYIVIITILLLILSIGIFLLQYYLYSVQEMREETSYNNYYVLIANNNTSSFWKSIYEGALEAGEENGTWVELFGENLPKKYTRNELMKMAIYSNVDGIIVEADESQELTELIDEATELGIPVVTIYSDNTKSERCSFVGIGSYNMGREYGKQVVKIIKEKKLENNEESTIMQPTKVAVLLNAYAKDSGQNILYSAIQEIIDMEENMSVDLSFITVDDTNAFSVEETIRDIFMTSELPDIVICLNEVNTNCIYQAVIDFNKVGEVAILGYYDSEAIVKAIERNVIYATLSVDANQLGKYSVEALDEFHVLGNTSQYFTTDIQIIDKDNVKDHVRGEEYE